jgi:hypothetical protein
MRIFINISIKRNKFTINSLMMTLITFMSKDYPGMKCPKHYFVQLEFVNPIPKDKESFMLRFDLHIC